MHTKWGLRTYYIECSHEIYSKNRDPILQYCKEKYPQYCKIEENYQYIIVNITEICVIKYVNVGNVLTFQVIKNIYPLKFITNMM